MLAFARLTFVTLCVSLFWMPASARKRPECRHHHARVRTCFGNVPWTESAGQSVWIVTTSVLSVWVDCRLILDCMCGVLTWYSFRRLLWLSAVMFAQLSCEPWFHRFCFRFQKKFTPAAQKLLPLRNVALGFCLHLNVRIGICISASTGWTLTRIRGFHRFFAPKNFLKLQGEKWNCWSW